MQGRRTRPPSGFTTLVGVGASGITGVVGGLLGVLLFSRSNRRVDWVAWAIHPDLMVFGFLTLFIITLAVSLLPRLNRTSIHPKLGLAPIVLLASATPLWAAFYTHPLIGDTVLLAATLVFTLITFSSVKPPRNTVGYGNIYFAAGALTLVVVATIKTFVDAQNPYGEWGDYAYTWLAVMGFPTSMILGVWQHTAHFRGVSPRKKLSAAASILWCAALATYILGATATSHATLLAAVGEAVEVAALAAFLFNLSVFTPVQLPSRWALELNKSRYAWFDRSMRIASLWLIVGVALQILYNLSLEGFNAGYGRLLDAWIHTTALGFYLIVIASYAPIMLPVLIRGKASAIRLTLIPQLLVSLGVAWRLLTDLLIAFTGFNAATLLEYSPAPVILAILVFLVDVHRVRGERTPDARTSSPILYPLNQTQSAGSSNTIGDHDKNTVSANGS